MPCAKFVTSRTCQFLIFSNAFLGKHYMVNLKRINLILGHFSWKSKHESNIGSVVRFKNIRQHFSHCSKCLTLKQREKIKITMVRHNQWRMGVMNFFPCERIVYILFSFTCHKQPKHTFDNDICSKVLITLETNELFIAFISHHCVLRSRLLNMYQELKKNLGTCLELF